MLRSTPPPTASEKKQNPRRLDPVPDESSESQLNLPRLAFLADFQPRGPLVVHLDSSTSKKRKRLSVLTPGCTPAKRLSPAQPEAKELHGDTEAPLRLQGGAPSLHQQIEGAQQVHGVQPDMPSMADFSSSPDSRLDLSTLPTAYLDAYPYPALVLVAPIPLEQFNDDIEFGSTSTSLPFTRVNDATPFNTVYSNDKWTNLSQGRQLLECIDIKGARRFGDWISGARNVGAVRNSISSASFNRERRIMDTSSSHGPGSDSRRADEAPEGFWEPEQPYEDRSSHSEMTVSDSSHSDEGLSSTLLLDLVKPGKVTLEMTKTSMPVYHFSKGGRNIRETHSFVIITTVPKSTFVIPPRPKIDETPSVAVTQLPSSPRAKATILEPPDSKSSLLSGVPNTKTITPTDEIMALDLGQAADDHSRPLMFSRDGTVSRPRAMHHRARDATGKSLDVHQLLEETDWASTSLGPREAWPQSLKTIVSLVMQYPHQCCLWWGTDLTLLYNAPYAEIMPKHPHLFGMSGSIAWAEIWSALGPLCEIVLGGTSVYKEDDFLLFKQLPHQGTATHEHYHCWMWVPVRQEDGSVGGLWNATIDTTKKVLAERRLNTVREMSERTSIARSMVELDSAVIEILGNNARDVPFAMLYHVEQNEQDNKAQKDSGSKAFRVEPSETSSKVRLRLAGSIGVPENHPSMPPSIKVNLSPRKNNPPFVHLPNSPTMSIVSSLSTKDTPTPASEDGLPRPVDSWPIKEALQTRRLVLVEDCSSLIQDYPVRIWDELPTAAIVVPIANDSDDGVPNSVIVMGLSIRRPFDDDYESFIHVIRLQMAQGIAAVRSYEAERQRIEELAALDRAKSLLFSNVSHELRTPLTLVSGPLDDILLETPEGPKREMLILARRNVRRLTRLVSTLMDVSRLEAGRLKGSFKLVNLGAMTRDLSALFRGAIERAKLRYIVDVDLSSRTTYVDPDHYEKIIFNLIGNALKYTMSGFVHVSLQYQGNRVILSVKDSGVGIPKSDIDLIGERFHRVESVSRSHEGTGIGLSLTKELIKLHGGVLQIDASTAEQSPDGSHGSTFSFIFPLGKDHLPPDAIDTNPAHIPSQLSYGEGIVDEAMRWNKDREMSSVDSSSESGVTSGESSGQSSRGIDPSTLYFKKTDIVLIVDDSADTRRYMRSIFAPFCTVIEARHGLEALDMLQQSVPDLIISDVMMPHLDGFGLLAKLKDPASENKLRMVPVIMLTARGGDEAKVEGILAGAEDYLAKPFNARELLARAHMQIQLGKKRKALEEAFDVRTHELRVLSDYLPVGIFRADETGAVAYANDAWYDLINWPRDEPIVEWGRRIHPNHQQEIGVFWQGIYRHNQLISVAEWQDIDGRWLKGMVIRLDLAARGLKGILGCITDITDTKVYEESQRLRVVEAEQRRMEAEEAKRQQELLIDITSHEIRNPISSLMQCSSLVKTNLLSLLEQLEMVIEKKAAFHPTKQLVTTINEDLEALESIYQCGLTQERISNDVLSLGRIQLDMLQMFDVETDLRHEAQKVISIFQNEARMKRIALSLKLGDSLDLLGVHYIKTDPVRLGQVVTNLLSNGIRFTSNSSVRRIELRYDVSVQPPVDGTCVPPINDTVVALSEDMPLYLYIAVTDTGPGLTPKELDLLFQRFSQVSPKTHTIFGGSGLGLFVCRKITELMGGRIEVASEHGKGSTFRFFIRTKASQTTKRQNREGSLDSINVKPSLKRRNTGNKGFATGPKPHVLIVEDNLINQTVLMRQLRHVGLTCEVASNGLEALEKVQKVSRTDGQAVGQAYDCVLMDLEMPVMDGLTSLKHIREGEAEGKLGLNLVIALTGNARQGQIDEAKAAGMDEVVIKPYRLDDLLQKIEDMMRIRAAKAQLTDPARALSL